MKYTKVQKGVSRQTFWMSWTFDLQTLDTIYKYNLQNILGI